MTERPRYREYQPAPALRRWVDAYWSIRSHGPLAEPRAHRVLPDGCVDLLFVLDGQVHRDNDDSPLPPGGWFIGPMQRRVLSEVRGTADLMGIRFRPGALRAGGVSYADLVDQAAPAAVVIGTSVSEWEDRLHATISMTARARWLDEAVHTLLLRTRVAAPDAIDTACDALRGERPRIGLLAHRLGLSERTLERHFDRYVGLRPKLQARVERFARVSTALRRRPDEPLTELAHRFGYSDQAHLTREFREFAGLPPTAWLAELHR